MCSAGGHTLGGEWRREVTVVGSGSAVVAVTRVSGLATCDKDPSNVLISNRTRREDGRVIEYRRNSSDVRGLIRMNAPILQLRPDLRHQHLDLFRLPRQTPGQQTHTDPLESLGVRQQLEFARLLKYLVLGPGVRGTFENYLADVGEASFLEPMDVVGIARDRTVVFSGGFCDKVGPVGEVVGVEEGIVVGGEAAVELLEFEVAARFGMSVVTC